MESLAIISEQKTRNDDIYQSLYEHLQNNQIKDPQQLETQLAQFEEHYDALLLQLLEEKNNLINLIQSHLDEYS